MIQRLGYWLELSFHNNTPVTSPTSSSSGLCSVQPSTSTTSHSDSELSSDGSGERDAYLPPAGRKSVPLLSSVEDKTSENDSEAASAVTGKSRFITAHCSFDSGNASDLTSTGSRSVHEVMGEANSAQTATVADKTNIPVTTSTENIQYTASRTNMVSADAAALPDTSINSQCVAGATTFDTMDSTAITMAPTPAMSNDTGTSSHGLDVLPPHRASTSTTAVFWEPEFPLLPASRGFRLSMQKTLPQFTKVLQSCGIRQHTTL